MPPSERQIELEIEKLKSSPGRFQTLVEQYARFTYPSRFKQVVPLGRDSNEVTVRGWPDIYSLADDFCLSVGEATHSSNWPKHLEEDIGKAEALGKGRFSSFLFVAWDNEPSPLTDYNKSNPRYEKLAHFRERLLALGIPADSISFVFKKQLISTLRQPRFAAVLKDILELSSHSFPFRLIRDSRLFGRLDRAEAFAPAEQEYREGLVHRANLVEQTEERLDQRGWALVRGRGAAGKTVLAVQIALDYERRSFPAYYLNLAERQFDVAKVLDVLTANADEQVLFIIDNVHLDEACARDVFDHWKQVSLGSHLLLLGRDVTVADIRGMANPLEDLQGDALTLTVSFTDLAGVFQRLAHRLIAGSTTYFNPPAVILEHWESLFGGDLIAFSAAVARRIDQLIQGDWHLQAQDAANYVRQSYLEHASEAERFNLLRIAVLAQVEMDMPAEAMNKAGINALLQGGLVHRLKSGGAGRYEHYHLIHPGLSELLLTAADYRAAELTQFKTKQLCDIARQAPLLGHTIAHRLEGANRKQEAIIVLQSILESDHVRIVALFRAGVQHLPFDCERLVRLGLLSEEEIDRELTKELAALGEASLHTPLDHLVKFLKYAKRKMPQTYAALLSVLARPENLAKLVKAGLRSPLEQLASFFDYAEDRFPPVIDALGIALRQLENQAILSETALRSPLDHLAFFLEYADRKLPAISEFLNSKLAETESINLVAETACRERLGNLLKFLRTARIAPEVVAAIDLDDWNQSRLAERSEPPYFFHGLTKELQRLGRLELAEAPAKSLIMTADPQFWHAPGISFAQISQVIRLGHRAGGNAVFRFLDRIASPAWLEQQYKVASAGAIASCLFSLWGSCDEAILDYFRVPALSSRLASETRCLDRMDSELLSAALSFLGSSALIGEFANARRVKWPQVQQIHEVVRLKAPRVGMTTVGYIQIQFWLGLREMARLRSDFVKVPAMAGEQILQLWKASTGYNNKQQALNVWMIAWLEKCARSNWVLIPDHTNWNSLT